MMILFVLCAIYVEWQMILEIDVFFSCHLFDFLMLKAFHLFGINMLDLEWHEMMHCILSFYCKSHFWGVCLSLASLSMDSFKIK